MRRPYSPCKDCLERLPGCHTSCFAFNVYKARLKKYKSLIASEKPPLKKYRHRSKSIEERRIKR